MSNQCRMYLHVNMLTLVNLQLSGYAPRVSIETNAAPRPRRLTQQERSAATRQALLDATIDCLIELGYEKATTSEISERALLSRGAHQHHFENRAKLFAAAAQQLALRSYDVLEKELAQVPDGPDRARDLLDVLWRTFNGPLYQVVVDLSVHARTDPELRAHLEPLEEMLEQKAWPLIRVASKGVGDEDEVGSLLVLALAT